MDDEPSVLALTLDAMKREWMAPLQDALLQAQNDLATLSGVVREIADLAAENTDLDAHDWNRVIHICSLPAVRNALSE